MINRDVVISRDIVIGELKQVQQGVTSYQQTLTSYMQAVIGYQKAITGYRFEIPTFEEVEDQNSMSSMLEMKKMLEGQQGKGVCLRDSKIVTCYDTTKSMMMVIFPFSTYGRIQPR